MPDAPTDPRRAGFATAVRPGPRHAAGEGDPSDQPTVRGLKLSAPTKPLVPAPTTDPIGPPADVPPIPAPPRPSLSGAQSATNLRSSNAATTVEVSPDDFNGEDPAVQFGSRRGSLTFVALSISGPVADAFEGVAVEANVVLGEVLIASVRSYVRHTPATGQALRRRRGGNPVRREIGLRPAEAIEIYRAAKERLMRPSALMREALQQYLPSADVFKPPPST
jgi:hypothetical protein